MVIHNVIVGRLFALVVLLLVSPVNASEEIRQLPGGNGSSIAYLLSVNSASPAHQVHEVVMLLPGGSGYVGLREQGIPQPGSNFLVRARQLLVNRGIAVALIDSPSDMRNMQDEFRMSLRHVADITAVADDVAKVFPGARLYLIGTSRGTVSAAYAGAALGERLAGVALTSSVFNASREGAGLAGFDFATIKAPLLFVHHADDACRVTPYARAQALSAQYPLITVHGGNSPQSGPCAPFSAHGYFGQEEATMSAIANWVLGQPFEQDIRAR